MRMIPVAELFICLAFGTAAAVADTVQGAVDDSFDAVAKAVAQRGMQRIVEIDHARLAAAEGEQMPPSRVQIFSDPEVNSLILQKGIRAGLDLPMRVLSYEEKGEARVSYTNAEFLSLRHGVDLGDVGQYFDVTMEEVLGDASIVATPAPTNGLELDYGIIELRSSHDFDTTIQRLEKAIMSQGDTVWFGEVDFSAEAESSGVELPEATLLLFGGPAPGGIAMGDFPAIGLDAFCQKLLVYTENDGTVKLVFNDIAALAELYYGTSAKPHHGLNKRLTETFSSAVN